MANNKTVEPTLLDALKKGAYIEWEDGFWLKAHLETKQIFVGHVDEEDSGAVNLNSKGVDRALTDIAVRRYRRSRS